MANKVWTKAEKAALLLGLEAFLEINSDEIDRMFDNIFESMEASSRFVDLLVQCGVIKFTPIERDT